MDAETKAEVCRLLIDLARIKERMAKRMKEFATARDHLLIEPIYANGARVHLEQASRIREMVEKLRSEEE